MFALQRFRGGVQFQHQQAKFTAGMRRGYANAEIASAEFLGHRRDAADLTADADFSEQPDAGEKQQGDDPDGHEVLVQPLVGGGDKTVPRHADHDVKTGIADGGGLDGCPELFAAVDAGHFAGPAVGLCCRELEQIRIRDRCAIGLGPGFAMRRDQNGAGLVDKQNIHGAGQAQDMEVDELLQVERSQQNEFHLAFGGAGGVGDLQYRYAGESAESRLNRHRVLRHQRPFEIVAVGEIEVAVGPQRIAKQFTVRGDRQYARILRVFFAHRRKE